MTLFAVWWICCKRLREFLVDDQMEILMLDIYTNILWYILIFTKLFKVFKLQTSSNNDYCESLGAEACKSWKQSLRLCRRHSWLDGQAGAHTSAKIVNDKTMIMIYNEHQWSMITLSLGCFYCLFMFVQFMLSISCSPKCCFYTCIVVQLCSIGWSISFSLRTTFEHLWRLSNWIQSFATLSAAQASSCKKNIVIHLNAPATW